MVVLLGKWDRIWQGGEGEPFGRAGGGGFTTKKATIAMIITQWHGHPGTDNYYVLLCLADNIKYTRVLYSGDLSSSSLLGYY